MEKTDIIERIEKIAIESGDDQIKLNALSYLLNRSDLEEKEKEFKAQNEKFREQSRESMATLLKTYAEV